MITSTEGKPKLSSLRGSSAALIALLSLSLILLSAAFVMAEDTEETGNAVPKAGTEVADVSADEGFDAPEFQTNSADPAEAVTKEDPAADVPSGESNDVSGGDNISGDITEPADEPVTPAYEIGWCDASRNKISGPKAGCSYIIDQNGTFATGVKNIGGKFYCFNSTGKIVNGWQTVNGKKYYFHTSSFAAITGWNTISGKLYYFNPKTGCLDKSNKNYKYSSTGYIITGAAGGSLVSAGSEKYFINNKGALLQGWRVYKNKLYYFDKSSRRAARNKTVSGIYFLSNGAARVDKKKGGRYATTGRNINADLKLETMKTVSMIRAYGKRKHINVSTRAGMRKAAYLYLGNAGNYFP